MEELNTNGMEEMNENVAAEPAFEAEPKVQTLKEFASLKENKTAKSYITAGAILSYVTAAVSAVAAVAGGNLFILVDVALVLGLGLGVHLGRSRVCAVLLGVYGLYNTIFTLITQHTFGGWLLLLAAVFAIMGTFKLQKDWKAYQAE